MEIMALFPKRVIRSETVSWLLPAHLPLPLLLSKVLPTPTSLIQKNISNEAKIFQTAGPAVGNDDDWELGKSVRSKPLC